MSHDAVRCVVLGGGGHARVLIDTLLSKVDGPTPVAVLDPNTLLWNSKVYGVPVRGGDDLLPTLRAEGISHFVVGVGSISSTRLRSELFLYALSQGFLPAAVIHPASLVSQRASLGRGCQLLAGSVVNAGCKLGDNVLVNTGAIVEHDCRISDHVHIATGASLASSVQVGRGSHIGSGATILQTSRIGPGTIVGAGAVVLRDTPPNVTVVGVPARAIRR